MIENETEYRIEINWSNAECSKGEISVSGALAAYLEGCRYAPATKRFMTFRVGLVVFRDVEGQAVVRWTEMGGNVTLDMALWFVTGYLRECDWTVVQTIRGQTTEVG